MRKVLPVRPRRSGRGFTLIELLVTVAIAAILIVVVAPSFSQAILTNRLAAYANNFVASAQLARGEAIKRNATVRVCRSADGSTCAATGTWQQGWIVFHDADNDAARGTGETVVQVQQALSADFRFSGNAYNLAFSSIGAGATPANLVLCRASPTVGNQERTVILSATGRASVTPTQNGTCS